MLDSYCPPEAITLLSLSGVCKLLEFPVCPWPFIAETPFIDEGVSSPLFCGTGVAKEVGFALLCKPYVLFFSEVIVFRDW